MAISAQRFNFLDKETNIGTKEFTKLVDNAVYNVQDIVNTSAIEMSQSNTAILNTLQSSVKDLSGMLENPDVVDSLKLAMDDAMLSISNLDLPTTVKDIFSSLKKLDIEGVKSFFKELLHVGSQFLCNNLDFLKLFALGYAINKNILSGLMIALLLSWLDRYCKEFTKEEMLKADNANKIDMMFPDKGVNVTSDNAFEMFNNYNSDYLKANVPLPQSVPLSNAIFLTNVIAGDIDNSILNLRNSEISHTSRNSYLNTLDTDLPNHLPGTAGYNNILMARGKLLSTPLISDNRRDKSIRYESLFNKLGSYIKNLATVNVPLISTLGLSAIDKSLFDKMTVLKETSKNSKILQSTPNGSFDNFNFSNVVPVLTPAEETYLLNRNIETDSHRLRDLHPTSAVFLQEA